MSGSRHTLTNMTVGNNGGGLVNEDVTPVESATCYGNSAANSGNLVNRGRPMRHNAILAAPA